MTKRFTNNRRIAKNTLYLYIRTILIMLVSLYTSRIVLQVLGETDLGIYNLVGSVVTLMSFLQIAQVKATSRFITYELGLNFNKLRLSRMYSLCMSIHIIIAIIILLLAETIGVYVINEYTSIPKDRIFAANIVYQFSIITFLIHLLRTPLDSIIIAHENMSVYAYMSIVEALLLLIIPYSVIYFPGDNLILYGLLVSLVALILFLCYLLYVKKCYPFYVFKFIWDKKESFTILSFSGWTLLGSSANTLTQQGVSILFNNFVGLAANTAMGFANQVNVAVNKFVSSFTTAFNPQIIKYQAQGDYCSLFILMNRASKFSFSLCYLIALPIIVNMDQILKLWLVYVPEYTIEFCKLMLVCSIIDATTGVFNTTITAIGKIKRYQIGISCSFFLDFIFAFILLKLNINPAMVLASRILTRGIVNMFIGMYNLSWLINFPLKSYFKKVLIPIMLTVLITLPVFYFRLNNVCLNLIVNVLVCFALTVFSLFFIIMDKDERRKIYIIVNKKLH